MTTLKDGNFTLRLASTSACALQVIWVVLIVPVGCVGLREECGRSERGETHVYSFPITLTNWIRDS